MHWWLAVCLSIAVLAPGCNRRTPAVAKADEKQPSKKKKSPRKDNQMGATAPQKVFGPKMQNAEALQEYIKDLGSSSTTERFAACLHLEAMRELAKPAVGDLKRVAARDREAKVRAAAQRALNAIEPTDEEE